MTVKFNVAWKIWMKGDVAGFSNLPGYSKDTEDFLIDKGIAEKWDGKVPAQAEPVPPAKKIQCRVLQSFGQWNKNEIAGFTEQEIKDRKLETRNQVARLSKEEIEKIEARAMKAPPKNRAVESTVNRSV